MAALTAQTVTAAGITPAVPVQISAWAGPDTISSTVIGSRGVIAEVANASGGSLDLRIGDPGRTPAGNAAANGYATITVPDTQSRRVYIGPQSVDPATGVAQVGASTTDADFTIRLLQY